MKMTGGTLRLLEFLAGQVATGFGVFVFMIP
jgi:hypothetical protein